MACSYYDTMHQVLEISTQLGKAVAELYLSEGLISPSVLRKGLFTTSSITIRVPQLQNHRFTVLEFLLSKTRQEMIVELNATV